ncbi:MAG: type I glutamate--ammonia ligase [Candidatus Bathyarchaeota archaeon]|nr:type I glutamate--ammonia ligase [Candidatus Bathyarchaeum tardum]WGM90582.1 MAG: type I glutamate--ammonia ligase [Candidatus Bathyarchaeum tardum]WNZ29345.1 MAG: type I glutamate--ammonia ligase [Candidatus Bathyarchaeota archaeon]
MDAITKAKETLKKNKIRWVHTAFVDIRGLMQDVVIPARHFTEGQALTAGIGFDGSSVRGFKAINESDMILKPAADTLSIIPWTTDEKQKSAIILGDVYEAFGGNQPSVVDPRGYVAKNAVKAAEAMGYTGFFGPELEYFVFKSIDPTTLVWDMWVSPKGGSGDSWGAPRVVPVSPETTPGCQVLRPKEAYFRPPPEDTTVEYRNEVASILEENFDTEIEMHHHEVATAGQIEIDFKYGELVKTADRTLLYKFVAKNIAKQHGLIATFMPKPVYLDNASGMHVHASLWSGNTNVMYDETDEYAEMSQTGRYFIGGLLDHARAITAVTCPTVNSYKRLVPGFEAPIFIMWSRRNRSAMIRVPVYFKGPEHAAAKRAELRSADPSCNSYLALAVILMAGLDGIKKKTEPGDPVDEDVYELPTERRKALGIQELPTTLKDALEAMKSDEVVLKALGSHIFDAFIDYKTNDWNQFCLYVTPWEIMKYLDY